MSRLGEAASTQPSPSFNRAAFRLGPSVRLDSPELISGKCLHWLMAWFARDKEKERFYLLPGMGGRNLRRKRRVILQWSIIAGLFTSAIMAGLLYLISRH
jgi:hypothetical protein